MIEATVLIFMVGLIVGSFLNVVVSRIDDLRSIFISRSHCPGCNHQLAWRDLIPVVSFVLLKARCRYCKRPISWQYPLVEIFTAVAFALLFLNFGLSLAFVYYAVLFSVLMVVLAHDLKTQLVPEEFVWAALALVFFGNWYFYGLGMGNILLGALVGGGLPAILVVFSKERWMGSGDIKIGLLLGAILGYPGVVFGLFLAFVLGSTAGIFLLLNKKKTMQDALPFAPFLIIAAFLGLLYGNSIINWYLNVVTY